MMRREPRTAAAGALAEAWQAGKQETGTPWRSYQGQTLTPLYGGGVKAGVVDTKLPVRASAIRGQLRFWWRLLQPRLPTAELFARERELWGGIASDGPTASKVRVRVREISPVTLTPAFQYKPRPDGRLPTAPKAEPGMSAYALFSAQGKRHETNHRVLAEDPAELAESGITFTLEIACPANHWSEVERALRWWASFGGLGARSRRGLGAVELAELPLVTVEEVKAAGGRLTLRRATTSAVRAWLEAVEHLRDFRQGVGIGRNPGQEANRPGRSRWPEADMIRRLSEKWAEGHEPTHEVKKLYPRAAFGLPIVFHFQSNHDPDKVILEPQDERFDRMASPLLVRPYSAGGGRYHPAALLLPGWEKALATDLRFKDKPAHQMLETWPSDPQQRQAAAAQIRPMSEHSQGSDPLTAFMEFFAREGS